MVKFGVPFDVAFSIDATTRLAWLVCFGENEGHEFDWHGMRWKKK